jgi:hypothetical protein
MLDLSFFRVTGSKSYYLVIVSPLFIPSASASATVRNFACMTDLPAGSNITKVTVFFGDKLVAYSGTFEAAVREIVSQWEDFRIGEWWASMFQFLTSIFRYSLTEHDV